MKKIVCVIPARFHSTRFPQKVLAHLYKKPMLEWVWDAAHATGRFDAVHFAIDHEETAALIDQFGGAWTMTDPACTTGTDRLIDFIKVSGEEADIWVNWQGDEPLISSAMIETLLDGIEEVSTLRKKMDGEAIDDPNTVKVVTDAHDNALYFSRAAIPFMRTKEVPIYKHFGIYAFTRAALQQIAGLKPCVAEEAEQLEQLRFLHHGLKIRVHETTHDTIGIDTRSDLALAEALLQSRQVVNT